MRLVSESRLALRTFESDCLTQEIGWYIRRAREERELATKALTDHVADAHLARAKFYEARIVQAHVPADGSATDDEASAFTMISQRLFPFHSRRARPLTAPLPL